jgi:tetratricopeptide (TPR) repeat protein
VQDDLSRIILKCLEKTKEDRYVSAEELKADLKEIAGQLPTTQRKIKKRKTITAKEVTVTLSPKKLFMPGLVLLAAAIVIVLLWHPWKQKTIIPSASGKPTLAVLFFQNSTGEKELDTWSDAITRMLIAHLTQSRYIKVLPDDRIFSIMKRLNLLESANYTTEDLRQIAEMGAVSHLIKGYFTKSPESFRIYFSVQESGSMEVVGSGYVEADNVGKIISMADELSPKIKDFLNLSEAQIRSDKDVSVAELMTSSADALMHYNEGIRQAGNLGFGKALKSFEKAVDLDPDFAMAYLNISALYFHARKTKEGQESLMKAVELKENASEWEQHVIDGYFYEREGNFVKAIESLKKVLEVVPEHRFSLTMLGFIYQDIGDYENAIKYWEKYNEYYPEEERGIYNLFTQYLYMGYFDKARELLERYPENFSDQMPRSLIECYVEMGEWDLATALADKYYEKYRHARHLRGNIYFYRDDFLMAEAEYKKNSITFRLDFIPIVRGRYRDAAERFLTNIVKAREEGKSPVLPSLVFLTHILLQMGQPEKALEEIEIALEIDESPENLFWKGMVQIHLGSVSEALLTAEKIKRKVEQSLMKGDMRFYHLLMAMIEKENRNYDKAIDFSQRALSLTSYWGLHYRNLYVDTLASSYYLKNDLEKARIEYEKSISLTGARFWLGDIYVKSYYMLGKIHEQQGKKTKAKEYYEKFLDLWHSADPGIAEVEDARSRLASLQVP